MSDLVIRGGDLLPPSLNVPKSASVSAGQDEGTTFSDMLKDVIADINKLQVNADEKIAEVQLGNTTNIHEAVVALEKADISFRAMMQVRNKIMDAYQEVMRIQV